MTLEQMSRGIAVHREAVALKMQINGWVLLSIDPACKPEVINVGDPVTYRKGQYHRVEIKISDAIRRLAFRQWKKDLALKFNELVRELNQLGVKHEMELIRFDPSTGDPA